MEEDITKLCVVTEQGMFGELEVNDPNVRELSPKDKDSKKKKKKHLDINIRYEE